MVFDELNALNVNEHTEVKEVSGKELTYLSWPWAWAEVKKRYPNAHYEIWRNEKGLPFSFDPETGYMVYTSVTIEDITHMMWLPVMDGANKAMRNVPYEYKTRYGTKTCDAATMMDINKTIMRCLVKNLAMFGLGLYIYAGEDLPESEEDEKKEQKKQAPAVKATPGTVTTARKVPETTTANPVITFLLTAKKGLANKRGIDEAANHTLFKAQHAALVKAKLAPDKPADQYTMEEAAALIDAMQKCFDPMGTEIKVS